MPRDALRGGRERARQRRKNPSVEQAGLGGRGVQYVQFEPANCTPLVMVFVLRKTRTVHCVQFDPAN